MYYIFKNKLSKGIRMFCKAQRILSSSTLLILHNCFIYPYIVYCNEAWGAASMKYLMSIVMLRVVRIILPAPVRRDSIKMFNYIYLQILSAFDVYVLRLSILAFKCENGHLAEYVSGFFIKNSEVHHVKRDKLKCMCPNLLTLRYRCVKVWNCVSTIMSTQFSIVSFRSNLRSFIFEMVPLMKCMSVYYSTYRYILLDAFVTSDNYHVGLCVLIYAILFPLFFFFCTFFQVVRLCI